MVFIFDGDKFLITHQTLSRGFLISQKKPETIWNGKLHTEA